MPSLKTDIEAPNFEGRTPDPGQFFLEDRHRVARKTFWFGQAASGARMEVPGENGWLKRH